MSVTDHRDMVQVSLPRSVILNCLEMEPKLDEIEKKMREDRDEFRRNMEELGVTVQEESVETEAVEEEVHGEFVEDEAKDPYLESMDRIATALEALCGLLIDLSGTRSRGRRYEAASESPGDSSDSDEVPTVTRGGYTVEEFNHPIDKSLLLYQIHGDGRTLVLNQKDYEEIRDLDDESFVSALDRKFLATNAMVQIDDPNAEVFEDVTDLSERDKVTRSVIFGE